MDEETKKIILLLIEKGLDSSLQMEKKSILKCLAILGFSVGTLATLALLCLPG
jgi:hypothetical protein